MKHRTLFHSYRTVATVVDTDTVSLRHLDREDLLRELLAFYRLTASIPVMPLFNCFPYLLTDLLNEYFPQAGYSLLDKREGKGKYFQRRVY